MALAGDRFRLPCIKLPTYEYRADIYNKRRKMHGGRRSVGFPYKCWTWLTSKGRRTVLSRVRDDRLSGRIRLDGDESDEGYQLPLQSIICCCCVVAAGAGDAGDGDGDVAEADASVARTRPTTWGNLISLSWNASDDSDNSRPLRQFRNERICYDRRGGDG